MARDIPPAPPKDLTPEQAEAYCQGSLPGLVGLTWISTKADHIESRLALRPELMAPNGYLHAASVIAAADTTAALACILNLPEGALNFTTIELKSNFTGTANSGHVSALASPVHLGRASQVWDSVVTHEESGKAIAHFRCTQMILYPQA
ncbi:MAG: PaaI family thioesterase [Euryhalocaulis sp.]|uniref:PaaI family thioesterase n=1 Tax=Euryhalocaulis sp. TaxID=2744307 RepID=UPI001802CB70|nr:PaaI family thioesterase [Euryhalocaulis sp.]MBA4800892.1 PaaI family thioesterase [Euryhalocaulis sp.]